MHLYKSVATVAGSIVLFGLCTGLVQAASDSADMPAAKSESKDTGAAKSEHAVSQKSRPRMDLAFCIDTTGSMQGEIDMVKTKTRELVAKLSVGKPAPVIRVGLVAYRDKGDAYVTKVFPFSEDIDKVVKDISNLKADGGGDTPEAVDQGLHAALKELQWDKSAHTAKLLFLIGDAGPHGDSNDIDWRSDCREAIARGIQVNTMGCQGLGGAPLAVFQEIAKLTDGKFESLAYRQEVVDASGAKRSIVYSSGGAYAMKSSSGGDWKSALAKGSLVKIDAPVAASTPGGGSGSVGFFTAGASPMMAAGARRARSMSLSDSPATYSGDRKDNNLDELMLNAAKGKAAKTLKVTY